MGVMERRVTNDWYYIETICVDEIEKVAHHIDCTCPSGEGESRSVPDGLCISNATTSANAMSMDTDINQEGRLLSQLSTLPEDVEATLQDEVRSSHPSITP